MTTRSITGDDICDILNACKSKLILYDDNCEKINLTINELKVSVRRKKKTSQDRLHSLETILSEEMFNLMNNASFIKNKETRTNNFRIDMSRFSGVLKTTEGQLLKMKEEVREIKVKVEDTFGSLPKQAAKTKQKSSNISIHILSSRQTDKPFIFGVLQPGQRYKCNHCNEPVLMYCPYLRHMEEYPAGCKTMKLHSYHCTKACMLGRGFQAEYLNDSKVICEETITDDSMNIFQDIGFSHRNIHTKDDSDSDTDFVDKLAQTSVMSHEQIPTTSFTYRRKDNSLGEKIVCVACHEDIRPDSYLTLGKSILQPLHITRKCVQSVDSAPEDFSNVNCFVYSLLRNHNELKTLLACGFYYNRIIGVRPKNTASKVVEQINSRPVRPAVEPTKISHFVYRRNDVSPKQTVVCVACKEFISHGPFVTRGDTFASPFHARRSCIQSGEDLSNVKCRVFNLLRNHNELKQLLACGFYYNNIIGTRPPNPEMKLDQGKDRSRDASPLISVTKDVGFIFNEEAFNCELLIRTERCQGCTQLIRQGDIAIRHRERIPREKLTIIPLLSQFYHPTKTCLINRGFTDKFLEFATCHVVLTVSNNLKSVGDMLVRCGFSSDNLRYAATEEPGSQEAKYTPDVDKNECTSYLFVGNCTRLEIYCSGCRFLISVNNPCFIYGQNSVQDNHATLFHIREPCISNYFTKTQMLSLTCINNDSLADVSGEEILACGIVNIKKRPRRGPKKPLSKGRLPAQYDIHPCDIHLPPDTSFFPSKLSCPTFIVDTVLDNRILCDTCKESLSLDKYVLKASISGTSPPINMHMTLDCVRRCPYLPDQLSECDLSLSVNVSPSGMQILRQCGFRNIPPFK